MGQFSTVATNGSLLPVQGLCPSMEFKLVTGGEAAVRIHCILLFLLLRARSQAVSLSLAALSAV